MGNTGRTMVHKASARVYRITIETPCHSWAHIIIEEWHEGGSLNIQSDYGNFAYSWSSIGPLCLREFLMGTQYDYFMSKAAPNRGREFSLEKSISALKREVLYLRKRGMLDREVARTCYGHILELNEYSGGSEAEYTASVPYELVKKLYGGDYTEFPYGQENDSQCVAFWERIWPVVCREWQKELQEERKGI